MIKTCQRCGTTINVHGNAKYCIKCRDEFADELRREKARRYYAAHRERIRERQRKYYAAHRERMRERQRKRYRQKCIERWRRREMTT